MASSVKLNKEDLALITEVFELVVKWKALKLSDRAWQNFNTNWAPSMVEQINNNEFKLNHPERNSLKWLIDQILHSRVLNSSGNPKNAVHLWDTRRGRHAIEILKAAARGQIYYDGYSKNSTFGNLFQTIDKK